MNTSLPGISCLQNNNHIILSSQKLLDCLSSAVTGGGFSQAHSILIAQVEKNYHRDQPQDDLESLADRLKLARPYIGLLTAAAVERGRLVTVEQDDIQVCALVTAGVSNATTAGLSQPAGKWAPGTINTVLVTNRRLAPATMVNAVITLTEAKADVLRQRQVFTPDGDLATGTSTDAVVVAHLNEGEALPYAGPATTLGWLIGRAVRQALNEVLDQG